MSVELNSSGYRAKLQSYDIDATSNVIDETRFDDTRRDEMR